MSDRTQASSDETRPLDAAAAPRAAHLLVIGSSSGDGEAGLSGRRIALPARGEVTVGRGDECDVRLGDASVSRRHAALRCDGGVTVEDLGSANGTRVRDRALRPGERVAVGDGDLVEFGGVLCMVRGTVASAARVDDDAGAPEGVVVADPAMRQLYALVRRVAPAMVPVLILGETGVGKEVVAAQVHRGSARAKGPYIKINCGNLTESLVEAELFGHEKGAFTQAVASRAGLVEAAHGGTLFLDEVGELPLATQSRLLRVLEDREVRRVGANQTRKVDVRFVAATHRDLSAAVAEGRFRADLFFRLNGFTLSVPPLRERPSEVIPLAMRFARRAREQLGLPGDAELDAAAQQWLTRQPWPGNIRELRNVVERAVLVADGPRVSVTHLASGVVTLGAAAPAPHAAPDVPDAPDAHDERARTLAVLDRCAGNQTRAAKLLGISRRTLVTRMGQFGLPRPRKDR